MPANHFNQPSNQINGKFLLKVAISPLSYFWRRELSGFMVLGFFRALQQPFENYKKKKNIEIGGIDLANESKPVTKRSQALSHQTNSGLAKIYASLVSKGHKSFAKPLPRSEY
ncbi:unnamed protein product [Ceratitis capitata]|uniref:(Mediterranean fruit fly) hypothetical protein n=1 Tax=Ceratitis capitata TaxID=7213 RepID=A0A811UX59_CERCA|nr:unnamed protein product [Ceratitis capitata]